RRVSVMMYNIIQMRKDHLFIIGFVSVLIFLTSTIYNFGHNSVTNIGYGQIGSDLVNSTNATVTNLVNLEDIPLEKVQVGDIEIAYKVFGTGEPLILHNGASDGMDAWDPSLLTKPASNNTV